MTSGGHNRMGFKHSVKTKRVIGEKMKGKGLGNQHAKGNKPNKTSFKKGNKPLAGFKKGQKPWNKGRKFPEKSGKNNPNWKGGITPINLMIRTSSEYKLWRIAIFERDNYTCIWCGAKSQKGIKVVLHADHIKPFALFPELRFAIDNGRTLCEDCHRTTYTYAGRIKK